MSRLKHLGIGALLVMATLWFSPIPMSISYAISTHDVAPIWVKIFHPSTAWLMVLPYFGILVAAPITFLASWKVEKLRPFRGYALLIWLLSWGLCNRFFGANAGWPMRRAGLTNVSTRAIPIIVAIENYRFDNGRPPAALSDLVPRYIAAIPATGMTAYPRFRYTNTTKRSAGATFHAYELGVFTPFGLSFDHFYYWPENNYPKDSSSGSIERVDKWAYLHE